MKGISTYVSEGGIRVARLHYSAHPKFDPDTLDGQENIRKAARKYGGMEDPKWQREMEINFSIRGSTRVWPDFVEKYIPAIVVEPFDVPEYWPKKSGYDYGHTNPFAFLTVAWEATDSLYVMDEVYMPGVDVFQQAKIMREKPFWSEIQDIVADPSIYRKDQHTRNPSGGGETRSIADLFEDQDIFMTPGSGLAGNDLAFRDFLQSVLWRDLKHPQLKIFSTCRNLLKELRLLRYREWATKEARDRSNMPEEIVLKQNHAWDALKYLMLATHAEAPPPPELPERSWGRLMRDLIAMKQKAKLVLG